MRDCEILLEDVEVAFRIAGGGTGLFGAKRVAEVEEKGVFVGALGSRGVFPSGDKIVEGHATIVRGWRERILACPRESEPFAHDPPSVL